LLLLLACLAVLAGGGLLWYYVNPPFAAMPVATVLIAGLDEPPKFNSSGPRRSDTIILCAVHMDGSGTTLLSVPRDARVRLPNRRRYDKINAAYAIGKIDLLRRTLAAPDVLAADLPYHLVIDSETVREVVDALGGITVDVSVAMHYDDHWGNLHIHLEPGEQRLTGEQAVGYLRWRKNNDGRIHSDDFSRNQRQRALLMAISQQARTPDGLLRLPRVYHAFRKHSYTNFTTKQLLALALHFHNVRSAAVPGVASNRRDISYVYCDWAAGRKIWQEALK